MGGSATTGLRESIDVIGMFPWDFKPNHLQSLPILYPFSSCSLLPLFCRFRNFSAPLQKSSTRFFSFRPFRTKVDLVTNKLSLHYKSEVHIFSLVTLSQRNLSLDLGPLSVTKVRYTFFLLSPFMHASSSSFDLVLRAKPIGEDPPLKGQENAAH
jgi:hypothetical protein